MTKTTTERLDELEAWLEDFANQDCASEVAGWLEAFRNLRKAVRPLEPHQRSVMQTPLSTRDAVDTIEQLIAYNEGRAMLSHIRAQ